jgi:NAD(P)-dependent dehydrogenase (short-subunit alcohol dehydrogenase family)
MGHFFSTVAFLPLLAASSASRVGHTAAVINTASMSGITRTSQHHLKYNASKAASLHLTTMLAQELRRPGVRVRVNSISPGIFPSEMTAEKSNEKNKSHIPTGDDYGEKKGIPAGRPGAEEDMAQAALFLGCCQYAYGMVRHLFKSDEARVLMIRVFRMLPSTVVTCLTTLDCRSRVL